MASTHRGLRVHGGRLVNAEPRQELEAGLDAASADGIAFTRDRLCFPLAQGSFEEGMGAAKE